MKTLNPTLPLGWRARRDDEQCRDCGAGPGQPCRVAFGKGPAGARPELVLEWGHGQGEEIR